MIHSYFSITQSKNLFLGVIQEIAIFQKCDSNIYIGLTNILFHNFQQL